MIENYEEKYGEIISVKIESYYKYCFQLEILTTKGVLKCTTGGDKTDIYRYNPYSTDWSEHTSAEINSILSWFSPCSFCNTVCESFDGKDFRYGCNDCYKVICMECFFNKKNIIYLGNGGICIDCNEKKMEVK
jgi:hypothetical protein